MVQSGSGAERRRASRPALEALNRAKPPRPMTRGFLTPARPFWRGRAGWRRPKSPRSAPWHCSPILPRPPNCSVPCRPKGTTGRQTTDYETYRSRDCSLGDALQLKIRRRMAMRRSAGFPACGFTGLSSPVFPFGNWRLESRQNPQTGMSALRACGFTARSAYLCPSVSICG